MGLFTKDIKTMDDLFQHGLKDIYYAEKRIVQSLPALIEKATNRDLTKGLHDHWEETKGQIGRLEALHLSALAHVLGHVRVHADLSASPHPGLRQRRLQKYSSGRADFDWYRERKAQPHKSDPIAPRWRSPRAPLRRYDLHHDLRGVNRLRLRPVPVRGLQQEVARLTSS